MYFYAHIQCIAQKFNKTLKTTINLSEFQSTKFCKWFNCQKILIFTLYGIYVSCVQQFF